MKLGQVIVTEGKRGGLVSWVIQKVTKSKFTHVFIVTGPDEMVEAWFPKVRTRVLSKRLETLSKEGREYVVLDIPNLTDSERESLAAQARFYVGRFYDVGQAFAFLLRGRFWADGAGTLICSRLVTATYMEALGVNLFPEDQVNKAFPPNYERKNDILQGWTVPADLLRSTLSEVEKAK